MIRNKLQYSRFGDDGHSLELKLRFTDHTRHTGKFSHVLHGENYTNKGVKSKFAEAVSSRIYINTWR